MNKINFINTKEKKLINNLIIKLNYHKNILNYFQQIIN